MIQVDIAIITIREDEYEAVEQRLPQIEIQDGTSGRTYGICQVQTKTGKSCKVAIARCSEQGNDVSQKVASDMIGDLDPQLLLVVGIAGGVPSNDFTLGDVIISSRIHTFNVNAIKQGNITFNVQGGIHPLVSNITASLPMRKSSMSGWNEQASIGMARPSLNPAKAKVYGDEKWQQDVIESLKSHFGRSVSLARLPMSKIASIASSNTLMKDTNIPTTWLASARSILAIEMESAGVLQAAQGIKVQYPVMAIRGISDIVGLKREDQWATYACKTAAAFTYAFIVEGVITPRETATGASSNINDSSSITQNSPALQEQVQVNITGAINVFISYAAEDEKFKVELAKHLKSLARQNVIHPVYSHSTELGLERQDDVAHFIDAAQIILLLISKDFLASDQIYDYELKQAMERHKAKAARVIPILLRPADLTGTPFEGLQAIPRHGKLVGSPSNDEEWTKIASAIRDICKSLREKSSNL